jgi:hypothetical protein
MLKKITITGRWAVSNALLIYLHKKKPICSGIGNRET